jgi:hypothetical protein
LGLYSELLCVKRDYINEIITYIILHIIYSGTVVVKSLCYKPEGTGSKPDEVNF